MTNEKTPAPQADVEPVQDTWFTDRSIPVMAISGDVESDRVLKLHFRRPVSDDDRKAITDALNMHQRSLTEPAPQPQATPAPEESYIDPRTGRPLGDHGTALQAINWALHHAGSDLGELHAFLTNWLEGNLDQWPEYYAWLANGART